MRAEVERKLTISARLFRAVVWPEICDLDPLKGSYIEPVEDVTEIGMAQILDILAGIDAWIVYRGLGICGFASRVQFVDYQPWYTTTFRTGEPDGRQLEFEKRAHAFVGNDQFLSPFYTCHAYLNRREQFLAACVCETKPIIEFILREKDKPLRGGTAMKPGMVLRPNGEDGNWFWGVYWWAIARAGIPHWIICAQDVDQMGLWGE